LNESSIILREKKKRKTICHLHKCHIELGFNITVNYLFIDCTNMYIYALPLYFHWVNISVLNINEEGTLTSVTVIACIKGEYVMISTD